MTENVRYLTASGYVRPGLTTKEVRDVLWFCTSPEFYDLMVLQRGWLPKRFEKLVADTIIGSLL